MIGFQNTICLLGNFLSVLVRMNECSCEAKLEKLGLLLLLRVHKYINKNDSHDYVLFRYL